MNLLRLVCLLSMCCFLGAAGELPAIPAIHPERIGGRWETVTPSGIEGLGFEILSQSEGPPAKGHFVFQNVNVRVYTREDGNEKWGYFNAQYRIKPRTELLPYPTSFEVFDGRHLSMHFTDTAAIAPPFDLDIVFVPKANKWIGTWSHDEKKERVTLIRPEVNTGSEPNRFVGEWIGQPSRDSSCESTTLNIRQSTDGILSAWLDRTSRGSELNGEQLNIGSISDSAIALRTNNSTGDPDEFRGSLSADGQSLVGEWGTLDGHGGTSRTACQFRRTPTDLDRVENLKQSK